MNVLCEYARVASRHGLSSSASSAVARADNLIDALVGACCAVDTRLRAEVIYTVRNTAVIDRCPCAHSVLRRFGRVGASVSVGCAV